MNKGLLGTVSVVALVAAHPAFAATPVVYNWTGCYVGANAGGGWSRTGVSNGAGGFIVSVTSPSDQVIDTNPSGFIGGGQVGCNYQFMPAFVVGLQGDLDAAGLRGSAVSPFTSPQSLIDVKANWLASVTGRAGYAWDRWLVYAKGGGAWIGDKYNVTYGTTWTGSETRSGWTLGGGVEWAFANNWSALFEYDYYDFGAHDVTVTNAGSTTLINVKQNVSVVKFGLNFHFGAP
ncbi:MAG TPA: outer membrane beta-barrel protein [Pseudolabrys sp.]|nr:outer membrane beta-barrel protein [Pseudolabrys sp.]